MACLLQATRPPRGPLDEGGGNGRIVKDGLLRASLERMPTQAPQHKRKSSYGKNISSLLTIKAKAEIRIPNDVCRRG